MGDMPWRSLRAAGKLLVHRRLDLTITGEQHLPPAGPAILAARHFHHLYDGCVILTAIDRPVDVLVALDWVKSPLGRRAMEFLCASASWPVILRTNAVTGERETASTAILRQGIRDALASIDCGRLLLMFPEGFPNIDPTFTPKGGEHDFLRFEQGFARLARMGSELGRPVPIIPAGLTYQRIEQTDQWQVKLAFGPPRFALIRSDEKRICREIERDVRLLSGLPEDSHGL
jgi:1-acyl-sn-glycerol-3-phosphate acyltransferase